MKYLITFLIFTSLCLGQTNQQAKMLVYPGCEKYVKKGNEVLQNCFFEKLINEIIYNPHFK